VVGEHQKSMMKCYTEAQSRLRRAHIDEFKVILAQVYEENGVEVRMRRSKEQILADRLAEARALLESHG
jgi:hypothetical protein